MYHDKPTRLVICYNCGGHGFILDEHSVEIQCPVCEGELEVTVVTIPEYEYENLFLDVVRMKVFLQEIIANKYPTYTGLSRRAKLLLRDENEAE